MREPSRIASPAEPAPGQELGRGRSAIVYRSRDEAGRDIALKVFVGDPAAKLVNLVLTGAPNAYVWNEDAVHCAMLRRRIVAELVEFWFGDKLEVADAYCVRWNAETRSFSMDTRLVEGRPASLHHPFSESREDEYRDLKEAVMRPLQARLVEAGLDGLVWQAGRGNPVAVANFLRRERGPGHCWAWIDLESGVPALAPLNPIDLFGFYLPMSWKHRRPLFDDVDVPRLREYVEANAGEMRAIMGGERVSRLMEHLEELAHHQDSWRALRRFHRAIGYRLGRGQLTAEEAEHYATRPLRWYAREVRHGLSSGVRRVGAGIGAVTRRLVSIDYPAVVARVRRFVASQRYRTELARTYVGARIDAWEDRHQLRGDEARSLHTALSDEAAGSYITDFGVHVSIKPAIKFLQWIVLPALFTAGFVSAAVTSALIVFGGMIGRTLYTLGRMVQSAILGQRLPWVALGVGLLPAIGNAAYPAQLLWESFGQEGKLAAFILYDTVTRVGERIPVWGGRDTGTEHAFNHSADLIVRARGRAAVGG